MYPVAEELDRRGSGRLSVAMEKSGTEEERASGRRLKTNVTRGGGGPEGLFRRWLVWKHTFRPGGFNA